MIFHSLVDIVFSPSQNRPGEAGSYTSIATYANRWTCSVEFSPA
jgi:hypothetical protein